MNRLPQEYLSARRELAEREVTRNITGRTPREAAALRRAMTEDRGAVMRGRAIDKQITVGREWRRSLEIHARMRPRHLRSVT